MSSLRAATLNKRLNIQRRLAWSLCKDDTQNRREAKPFFSLLAMWIIFLCVSCLHSRKKENTGGSFFPQQRCWEWITNVISVDLATLFVITPPPTTIIHRRHKQLVHQYGATVDVVNSRQTTIFLCQPSASHPPLPQNFKTGNMFEWMEFDQPPPGENRLL